MLISCTLTVSAMVVPMLLLKNTAHRFVYAEFRIVGCVPRRSIHCVNMVSFPVLMFHLNGHVNNMWRKRRTFLKWYNVALLLAREEFLHVSVFHKQVYGEHCMNTACTHLTHSVCKIYTQWTVPCSWILSLVTFESPNASINTIH